MGLFNLTEKKVFYRQLLSLVLLLVSLVTSGLVWGHWEYTLDTCTGYNCGCILYGVDYDGAGFSGGRIQYCQFVTLVQVPIFIVTAVLVFYYGYRVCIKSQRRVQNAARRSNPLLNARQRPMGRETAILDSEPPDELDPPSMTSRICLLVTSIIIAALLLAAAVTATSGFYTSCKEYRKQLIRELVVGGNAAQVVGSRMSCLSVFDFLDYLQPDRPAKYDERFHYSRKDRINTGITLFLAKGALFMNFMNWLFITIFHVQSIRKPGGCCSRGVSYKS